MILLAFDTSTAHGSVAVSISEKGSKPRLLANREWTRAQSHSEMLTSEIQEALKDAGISANALHALAVGQGPGSFTGIRVAINAARALGYALKIPVSVFDTTEILVEPIKRQDLPLLTIVNAQKNSFFVSAFNPDHSRATDIEVMSIADLENVLAKAHVCVGDGCALAEHAVRPETKSNFVRDVSLSDFPLATSLCALTFSPSVQTPPSGWNMVQALYIRASGAEESLKGK